MVLGSVQREKGHWLLLDALDVLVARHPRTRLVLVCGGADHAYATSMRGRLKRALGLPLDNRDALLREAAERGLAHRLLATGYRRDVPRLLAAADVLVFPSLAPEGFGRPIVEAMAMARPVVATDVRPCREILGPEAGLLVQPQPRELANALATLLESPDLREQLGRAGRARVETLFSLDRQVAEMAALYHEVACRA
jgi:glycosyltransferase involved in cell wall biosynthesis